MTVDPTDPETFEPDENGGASVPLGEETPEADAAEQHRDLQERTDEPLTRVDPAVANEADAAEQTRVVTLDEDDYR
ncbi:hypothetical protein [Streptomyces lavendofoliae]|uniref:DUF5709 domain-containing protein n=1 Tax=Streptomyces lavendofoliae TaxID=67314 RepID=A0A918M5P2_9ACTN|nr:hypothetical protein [Streptomyces lavendofoliae]GGU53031.1 hypothetical protein GCM10010274_47340 [Streptomyces lavendofoliae]